MNMLKSIKIIGLFVSIFLFNHSVWGSLLIEPHIGYNVSGSGEAGSTEYEYTGAQYGARLGFQFLGLMTGLDYTKSSPYNFKTKNSGATTKYDRSELGVFAGYDFPLFLRLWGAYYFSNTAERDPSGYEMLGNSQEVGVGFKTFPFISLNLIYRMHNYDEAKTNGVSSSLNPETKTKEIVVGVSFPITL